MFKLLSEWKEFTNCRLDFRVCDLSSISNFVEEFITIIVICWPLFRMSKTCNNFRRECTINLSIDTASELDSRSNSIEDWLGGLSSRSNWRNPEKLASNTVFHPYFRVFWIKNPCRRKRHCNIGGKYRFAKNNFLLLALMRFGINYCRHSFTLIDFCNDST